MAALDEFRAFENIASEYQQDRDARLRDLQSVGAQLEAETAKRTQLEKAVVNQKSELFKFKEHNSQLSKDLMKALKDLKDREWDVKQLESKQDKTIVEHVHVLEEAKRVTDKELVRAQAELEKRDAIIRSLQTTKQRRYEPQVLYDNEVSKSADWPKEKERLETKIADLERECEASSVAQSEQQSQIVSLHSQIRELRGVLDEAEVERTLLQKARRALQSELDSITYS